MFLTVVVVALGVSRLEARAQGDHVARVNAVYAPIAKERRSDLVLFPLVAKMAPIPVAVNTLEQAVILPADVASFKPAGAWAAAEPQQAIIRALSSVTKEMDWRKAYAFGQPYGADGVPAELIRAGLYTDLGDPPTLAARRHLYAPSLEHMAILVNVEASRLVGEGKPSDAIDVLIDWAFFCRSVCDRQFFTEAAWGLNNLAQAYERIRDVAYTDMMGARVLDQTRLIAQIQRMAGDQYLDLNRMTFPIANRAAVEQMIERVYVPRGRVDERVFGTAMARLGSSEHPLRLFSETAQWRTGASAQVDWFQITEKTRGVFDDWADRWKFPWFDARQNLQTVWSTLEGSRNHDVLTATTPDLGKLAPRRQIAKLEGVGTRSALAALGATYARQSLPPQLSAVRPRWLTALEDDPYNPNARTLGTPPPLEYFVPMRDTPKNARGEPEPYEMSVVTSDPAQPLSLRMTDDTFVIYSWGSDNAKNFAKRTQNTSATVQGADYLIWPPVSSLQRKNLRDLQRLK
ncbi:MAG: hypothetical protein HBSAPP03_17120 [Phycisphaerae bacterium]|nr:MAG: hypothetical protein HBSAPP03_17120 [Phycisphaerae bacterium]